MAIALEGVLPALITPLSPAGDVLVDVLERLLERLYAAGVHGVYVCGNTGEGMQSGIATRKKALDTAVRCSPPGKLVVAHVGARNLEDATTLARHAADTGAHALSSLPPAGDFEAIHAWYSSLASATNLPFLIYYFPEAAPGIRTMAEIHRLGSLSNIAGLKFTDFDLYRMSMLSRAGLTIFNGRDEVFAAGMLMGAHGGIGSFYNIAPELFLDVYRLAREGRYPEARRTQDRINDLISIVLRFPMIPALKAVLEWRGLPCGLSLTARPLSVEECGQLRFALEQAGFG
jgi:N-acetylneuraminate lyase